MLDKICDIFYECEMFFQLSDKRNTVLKRLLYLVLIIPWTLGIIILAMCAFFLAYSVGIVICIPYYLITGENIFDLI